MPNGEENDGGLNLPVAGGGKVDDALRSLLKAISESPEAVGDFQIKLNMAASVTPESPALDFTAGSYIRRILPDQANPGTNKIVLTYIPDDPQALIEDDIKNHPNPADKVTWEKLLGNPPGINIDEGVIFLRMDKTGDNFMISWLPNSAGAQTKRKNYKKPAPGTPPPPVGDLAAFLACMEQNSGLPAPSRLALCISSL